MDLHTQLKQIIDKASQLQALIDQKESWFDEPHQDIYLQLIELLDIYEEKIADIESISLDGVDVNPALLDARKTYDEYYERIPYFLSEGGTNYFLIKSYYSVCFQLIKSFSYSSHTSDHSKITELKTWIAALDKAEKSMDAADSAESSLDFLRPLQPFNSMPQDSYAQFQEEVKNLQSLLTSNPELENSLAPEDLSLLAEASAFLNENPHLFISLQFEEAVIEFDNEAVHEIITEKCHQLTVFLDQYKDQFGIFKKVKNITHLHSAFNECFDRSKELREVPFTCSAC